MWNDESGTSSTLTNIFSHCEEYELAHIYIETKKPHTNCCSRFFQISEMSLIKKIVKWNTKTGVAFDTAYDDYEEDKDTSSQEEKTMNYVRGHRSIVYSLLRDLLWRFNGWKSKELESFLKEYNPDIIWFEGSPLPLMNRLYLYVKRETQKPSVVFLQDDVYSYKSCTNILSRLYRFMLRRSVKKVVACCTQVFTICPKMKEEYDPIFHINSIILTKGIEVPSERTKDVEVHSPIKMVYLGQLIYGRNISLLEIVRNLNKVNQDGEKVVLDVYTQTTLSEKEKEILAACPFVTMNNPIPYGEVESVIKEHDVVLFIESFDPKFNQVARLSFSTKITDYLAAGKCIFAVGPGNIAPIEYFVRTDSAIVVTDLAAMEEAMKKISSPQVVNEYAQKAKLCGIENHSMEMMRKRVQNVFNKIIEYEN